MKIAVPSSNERFLQPVGFDDGLEVPRDLIRGPCGWIKRLITQTLSANVITDLGTRVSKYFRMNDGCCTGWRFFVSSGSSNCLSKIRELDEDPGMNTTEGFEGSPTALVQSFVPSSDVTNLLEPMLETNGVAGTGDGKSEGLRHRRGGLYNVSSAARIVRGVNTE